MKNRILFCVLVAFCSIYSWSKTSLDQVYGISIGTKDAVVEMSLENKGIKGQWELTKQYNKCYVVSSPILCGVTMDTAYFVFSEDRLSQVVFVKKPKNGEDLSDAFFAVYNQYYNSESDAYPVIDAEYYTVLQSEDKYLEIEINKEQSLVVTFGYEW